MRSGSLQGDRTPALSQTVRERLALYVALLKKWNPAINLVSARTLEDVDGRHVRDSLQIVAHASPDARSWADLGSGAGLPGMVVAIALSESRPDFHMTLVEADQRKAEFLRTVSRETEVAVTVLADRIEAIPPLRADTLSARALAPLGRLCSFAHQHMAPDGRAIFLKGALAEAEIANARRLWRFRIDRHGSETNPTGSILVLSDLHHV